MTPEAIQIETTMADRADAQRIATALVAKRLAACVHVDGPIDSMYRWEDTIEEQQEWRLTIKTRAELYDEVEAAIRELHPYDEPEILATAIVTGSPTYLKWLRESVG